MLAEELLKQKYGLGAEDLILWRFVNELDALSFDLRSWYIILWPSMAKSYDLFADQKLRPCPTHQWFPSATPAKYVRFPQCYFLAMGCLIPSYGMSFPGVPPMVVIPSVTMAFRWKWYWPFYLWITLTLSVPPKSSGRILRSAQRPDCFSTAILGTFVHVGLKPYSMFSALWVSCVHEATRRWIKRARRNDVIELRYGNRAVRILPPKASIIYLFAPIR